MPSCAQKSIHTPKKPESEFISNFAKDDSRLRVDPSQRRWKPMQYPAQGEARNWLQGITTMCGAGDPSMKDGLGIHVYACNQNMGRTAYYSADGDYLIVPQEGTLFITTEFGRMTVKPREICVIQRGIKFKVDLDPEVDQIDLTQENHPKARGYMCEVYKSHFVLPDAGPIGSNSLAYPQHFQTPVAWYEDSVEEYTIVAKFSGELFSYQLEHSPFDVVAWHGNYVPYKYNLELFNVIGSISYDHPDPSIFTVLTAQSDDPGQAVCDFVIFPGRWLVAEHTFRPPYYHRNTMTEFMGNICGTYDAKQVGFVPGSSSLHSAMSGHGPESQVFDKASDETNERFTKPMHTGFESIAFMFETCYMMKLTEHACKEENMDASYVKDSYSGLKRNFNP